MKWHQDIQFWPHTNYDLITIGVYLEDVVEGQGEMGFIPKSHDGPPGILILHHLLKLLRSADEAGELSAEFVLFPMVNPLGMGDIEFNQHQGRYNRSSG